ncbi:uncharacterized protein LOC141695578 [Apium graveolens]|uniref:uncharacterized protein LOC141695578 n=1 Tax=Apium graveolens TaxID=4045 RepID=UPI003D7A7D5F
MQTPPESRPYNRQYDYHETHGHKTENCLSLKYFIEDQVKKGNMNKYLVRDNSRGEAQKKGNNVVNVVLGGSYSPPRNPDFGEEIKFPTPTGVGEIKGDCGVAETCYNQGLIMAETHQDNKRKATVLRKQQSMKKHRTRTREEPSRTSPEELASNQVMVVDKINRVLDQPRPTMQATEEPEKGNNYLKKNSEARIHQMISNKEQAKIEAAVETEEIEVDETNSSKKSNGKWRMCVDYTDLNNACPKDPYPLPNIDQLIDATSGHVMLSFMDAFSGYNQIKMSPKDIPKTAFITHRAVYAYVMLPFGLTSAGSTYQRAMNKIFKSQIGKNLECYVDDMISKSTTIQGYVEDLKECFENLRKNQLKLNPEKCTFGVGAGKFLGATNKKEVNWSPECQKAFEEIKTYLSQPPVLTKAKPEEPLYLYLSAGAQAVGAALIREENGTQQPVYYVSQVLKDAETRYPRLEKFAFALVTTSRKLRHYFQGREIRVVTNQPLRKILHKPDISGRLVNWAVELSQFNLSFIPRTAIKAQALADFIIECNFPEEDQQTMDTDQEPKKEISPGAWTLKVDGSSTTERSGAGLILRSPEGFKIQTAISFNFPATNNQAEYEALIAGLKLSRTLRVQDLKIYSDSQIVVKQINGEYIAKDPTLAKYQALVQSYLASIPSHQFTQICREENEEADILSKLVRNSSDLDCSVYFEELHKPSIESGEILEIESTQNWMTPFIKYLDKGELPEDKGKAQRLKAKAAKFFLEEGVLYRRTFSSPTLKCIDPEEAKY